jgi:hypothetical protein
MNEKVNEKGLASGKRCQAFFLGEHFEISVCQVSHPGTASPVLFF